MGSDPSGNLLYSGSLELPVSCAILEGRMPSGRKKGGGLEVAGLGRKKGGLSWTNHLAEAQFGIVEFPTDKVGASVSGMGAVRRWVGDDGVRGRVLKGEERIGEEIQGVGDASGACLGDEDKMTTIVGYGGGERKTANPMMGP